MFPVYHRTPLTSDGLHLAFHLKERPIAGREMRAANAVLDDGTAMRSCITFVRIMMAIWRSRYTSRHRSSYDILQRSLAASTQRD
jgi:hypothetical protein